ncbi:MAG TPA: hypothetical protein VFE17_13040 [Candidatus Baltobacteraceae bacterium]|jgi:hypothetical protein|nr:hypothetical protein [Candidatus Baltobacteraceae bacterium]
MIPLVLSLALAAPLSPPDGTYSYTSMLNGTSIAKTAITVKHSDAGVTLNESGTGSMNGQNGSIADTLTLDATLSPAQYSSTASLGDSRNMKSTVAFTASEATQTGDVNKKYDLVADAKHFVLLDLVSFTGFFALPAQMQAWNRTPVIAVVPTYGQGIPLAVDPAMKPARPAGVPAGDAPMSFNTMMAITVWYDPATLLVDEVDVPAQGVTIKRLR